MRTGPFQYEQQSRVKRDSTADTVMQPPSAPEHAGRSHAGSQQLNPRAPSYTAPLPPSTPRPHSQPGPTPHQPARSPPEICISVTVTSGPANACTTLRVPGGPADVLGKLISHVQSLHSRIESPNVIITQQPASTTQGNAQTAAAHSAGLREQKNRNELLSQQVADQSRAINRFVSKNEQLSKQLADQSRAIQRHKCESDQSGKQLKEVCDEFRKQNKELSVGISRKNESLLKSQQRVQSLEVTLQGASEEVKAIKELAEQRLHKIVELEQLLSRMDALEQQLSTLRRSAHGVAESPACGTSSAELVVNDLSLAGTPFVASNLSQAGKRLFLWNVPRAICGGIVKRFFSGFRM